MGECHFPSFEYIRNFFVYNIHLISYLKQQQSLNNESFDHIRVNVNISN